MHVLFVKQCLTLRLTWDTIIQIDQKSLAYDLEEFKGEMFRMTLSCRPDSEVPTSGCLFFKVFGRSNLTKGLYKQQV